MANQREKLLQVAALQQFNGSFALDANLCQMICVDLNKMLQVCQTRTWNPTSFGTVLALVYFINKLSSVKDDWELIADKSKIWLLKNHRAHADDMFESAMLLVV